MKKYRKKKYEEKFHRKKIHKLFGVNQPPVMADLRQRFTKKRWRESATPWLIHAKCALLTTFAFIMTMSARSY